MSKIAEIMARAIDAASFGQLHVSEPHAMAQAALTALEQAGYVVVPKEPTERTIAAGLSTGNRFGPTAMAILYRAMLSASQVQE